ncbi:hypothetical protein GI584_08475 [Gracilibacillus salitolerans]|uniref:Uncharacterized protein n=1 Tax=Gracilibacillus salitolerans TaxID=2663022 RepID=A0A5Q2TGT8_9BACI|nr:hypothetical protein [Gracilibacillus salitolerans]QGH34054.1 hypothetical protein GI584_08475 [Gracilibacillus salitolerans]
MKVILNNDRKSLIHIQTNEVSPVIQAINELIGSELIISHLIIDDQTIYSDHELYIENYIKDIKVIDVIAKTRAEFINDTLLTTENYLLNSFVIIDDLTSQFYSNPIDDSWNTFKQLTNGIQWLTDMIFMVDRMVERPNNWEQYVEVYYQLQANIKELADALENHDIVLIADIIHYEIKALFETLMKLITNTIDQEGSRHDVN